MMRYELMQPRQLRAAMDQNWPCVLPVGVLEYHGEHLGLGVDTLVVERCLQRVETEIRMVMLPPVYYGAASYAVAAPERNGTIHVGSDALEPFARHVFAGLLRVGFRNIHVIVHHQSENFAEGMPTDLAFRHAARQAIFSFLEKERGEGWWGSEAMCDYYTRPDPGTDPFRWIRFHPLMDAAIIEEFAFDHAGVGETSLMMALCPEAVAMDAFDAKAWYSRSAAEASAAFGRKGVERILERLKRILS